MSVSDRVALRAEPDLFVGRSSELAALEGDLGVVPHPAGPVRLLRGVAGVGKTRLAEELARRARASGVTVAWGHSPDELTAPPYWPWTQVVRTILGQTRGSDLAAIVIDEAACSDGIGRFELFDATASIVSRAADDGPLLVILDDLHAADHATLQLTRFLARHLGGAPILMVATVQTGAVDDPVVSDHLDALARRGHEITLSGLTVDDVGDLLVDPGHASAVHAATGGNPLHVHQVVRVLGDVGSDPAASHVDDTLRRTLARRIQALGATPRLVLEGAAVLGPGFDRRELAELVEPLDPVEVDAALAHLVTEGFVAKPGSGRFRHPLVAEVTRAELTEADRRTLHHRAAELICGDDDRVGQVAHHLLAAGPRHRYAAVVASRRAAALATAAGAHEDAAAHLTKALTALDAPSTIHFPEELGTFARQRLDVLLDLGATLWRAGRTADADAVYEEAWLQSVAIGDATSLARAVLRNGVEYYFADGARSAIVPRVERALGAQPPGPSPTRARLLAEMATHHLVRDVDTGRALADQAVAMARGCDHPLALGNALIARQVTDLGPATLARRIADGHEILACARDAGDYRLSMHGRFLLMVAMLEAGDMSGLDGELLRHDAETDELGEPRFDRFALWLRATRAMFEGDIATAETLAEQTFEISTRLGDPDAFGVYGGQVGVLLWMQGRVLETEPVYAAMRAAEPHEPLWPAVLAWLAATHGQTEAARGALSAVPDPGTVRSGMHWLLTATTYAEVAAMVGTDAQVDAAWNALVPYADRMVPVAMGAAVWGTVAKPLGHLAIRRGHVDEGISYLRTAMRTCARLGARPWMIEAQLDLADALATHRRGGPDAATLRAEAADAAHRLGLDLFIQRIEATVATGPPRPTISPDAAIATPSDPTVGDAGSAAAGPTREATTGTGRPRVRVVGGFEVTDPTGITARWQSRKARELLKILVSRRGAPASREVLMDLLWPGEDPAILANRLSVALSTVRRALDPSRAFAAGDLVSTSHDAVTLNLDLIDVDLEELLDGARTVVSHAPDADGYGSAAALASTLLDVHRGEALPDEPHADWARAVRNEARVAMTSLARLVATDAERRGDHLGAVEAHHRILDIDPFDEVAHLGLTAAFRAMGAHGQAETAYATYVRSMTELGVPVTPRTPA